MRLNLDESLEAYAARHAMRIDDARPCWRQDAMLLLHLPMITTAHASAGLCRIAPGVAVPTSAVTWSDEP